MDNKSYTYPQLPQNRLRKKADLYFQNMEIAGSKEGTEKESKMVLLLYYCNILFPWLEELAKELD